MSERKGDQRSGVPRSQAQHVDRRSERGLNRQDLRLTLRRDKNPDRSRERVHIRDRERDRERERGRERERERDRDHKIDIERKQTGVSSVVRTKPPEDEEQPDTSIASVVRVKPRPRIPAAIQANRNLILKAVAEAQKSVSKAPVRSLPVERLAEDKTQSFSSSHPGVKVPKTPKVQRMFILQKNEGRLPAREDLQKMSITVGGNLITGEANSKIQNDSNDGSEEIENSIPLDSPLNLLIEVPTSPVVTESTNPQDTSQTEKVLRWIEDVEEATKSMDDPLHTSQDISLDGVMVRENAQQSEADEDGGMEIESETGNIRLDVDDEQDMDITLGPDMDDIETGMGMEESGAVHSGKARQEQQLNSTWSSGTGPQFVVTLDGLDPKLLRSFAVGDANMELPKRQQVVYPQQQQENTAEEHTHHDQQEQQEQQLRQELLKQQAIAKERQLEKHKASVRPTIAVPPAVSLPENTGRVLGKRPASPIRVSEGPPLKVMAKVSSLERCKYWPACKLKEKCEYHHPSGPCKLFPNCKFADRCLYIHPKCRYDTGCVRRDCQYSHTSSRPTPSTGIVGTQPIQQACKFFPNCNNPSCPFIHPKVCRFGTYCTTLNCQFIHDDRYVPTKHKWIRH